MEEFSKQTSFCSVYFGECVCVCVSQGLGGGDSFQWFISQTHSTLNFHLMCSKSGKKKKKPNWILNLTWSWRSEQARGESLNKAWPWLHTTLFVPCIINVNSECCTVNTWMDFLEKAALASFSAHVHIYKYIYIYIW